MNKKDLKALAKNVKGILLDKNNRISFIINNLNTMYFGSTKAVLRIVKDSSHNYKDFVLSLMSLIGVDLISSIDAPYYLQYTKDTKVFSRLDLDRSPLKGCVDIFYKLDNGFVDLVLTDYLRLNNVKNLTRVIKLPKGSKAFVDQNVLTVDDVEIYIDNALLDGIDTTGLQLKGNIMNDIDKVDINARPLMLTLDSHLFMVIAPMVIK
jgi:hypothetical protein